MDHVGRIRKWFSLTRGVAAIEFALILPVFFLILFGVINFGIMIYDKAVIVNAAREGARWAAINTKASFGCAGTNTGTLDPCEIANSYTNGRLISFVGTTVSHTAASGTAVSGTIVTVTVSFNFAMIGWISGAPAYTLSATTIMYHE